MNYKQLHDEVYSQDTDVEDKPHGWIQWKGTDVCIDLRCECGHHGHFDGDFFYFFECPECKRKYAVGSNVLLIPLTEEQAEFVVGSHAGFKTCELNTDD